MPIPLTENYEREARAAKTYTDAWLSQLIFRVPGPPTADNPGSARVVKTPYDAETGEIETNSEGAPLHAEVINFPNLFELIANVPSVAAIVTAMPQAVADAQAYLAAQEAAEE